MSHFNTFGKYSVVKENLPMFHKRINHKTLASASTPSLPANESLHHCNFVSVPPSCN